MLLFLKIILFSFQAAAFIVAASKYQLLKKTSQRYFLFFLAYVVINEIVSYMLSYHFSISNLFLYNIFTVISFLFYLYWFGLILKTKKLLISFTALFLVSIIFSLLNEDFFKELWSIPLTTGTILILICAILFYYNLLNKAEIIHYQSSQKFWLVTGLLIFYIGYLPINLLSNYISPDFFGKRFAIMLLNILMYGSFIKSFLCLKK